MKNIAKKSIVGTIVSATIVSPITVLANSDYNSSEQIVSKNFKTRSTTSLSKEGTVVNLPKGDILSVRDNADSTGKKLGEINEGYKVHVTGEVVNSSGNKWYKINYKGTTGYVSAKYITISNVSSTLKKATMGLNLRKTASWSGQELVVIPNGATVNVLSSEGEWTKVNYFGTVGYCSSKYLASISSSSGNNNNNNSSNPSTGETKSVTDNVNLRKTASWQGEIIRVIKKGEQVKVISSASNGWSKVDYNGSIGYISSDYISGSTSDGNNSGSNNNQSTNLKEVTADVNQRKTASWQGEKIQVIKKGQKIEQISISGDWIKCTYANKTGYVPAEHVKNATNGGGNTSTTPEKPSTDIETLNKTGKVVKLSSTETLNVRSLPTTSSSIIGKIYGGSSVKITGKDKKTGWYRIDYNGKDGFVSNSYIEITSSSTTTPVSTYKKTTADLNMRTGPSTSYSVITKIPTGTSVKVLSSSNGWDKVEYAGKTGYCSDDYLVPTSEAPTVKKITTTAVNFRTGPSTSHSIITKLAQDTVVDVLSTSGDWDKVKVNGKTGYIHNDYLKLYNGSSSSGGGGSLPPSDPSFKKRKVVIDAGHGGHDAGAVAFGRKEKDIALSISKKVNSKLKTLGFNTIMTRSTDVYIPLSERYSIANRNSADMFVSIHLNSASSSADGIETLYKNYQNFANDAQTEMIKATNARNRGLKYRSDLAVLNGTKMPSILIETGFISNSSESSKLATDSYQDKLATAIARGISNYSKKLG